MSDSGEETMIVNTYADGAIAATNWVTDKAFELPKHGKRTPFHRLFQETIDLYPSKETKSVKAGTKIGLAEKRPSSFVDFIRLDRNERGVHFNATYIGKAQHVPDGKDRKKCAVYVVSATEDDFTAWVNEINITGSVQGLWDAWAAGNHP